MGLVEDIEIAARERGIDPYTTPFSPRDLGLQASDYGSFSDYCSDTQSAQYNERVYLKVAGWNNEKPAAYLLLPLNERE